MAEEQLRILVSLRDLASKELKSLGGTVASFASKAPGHFKSVAGAVLNLKNAIVGSAAAIAAYKAVDLASNLETVGLGFENLTREIGGAEKVLQALREGTRGTVSDFKLMETANKAILLNVAQSAEEFEELTTIARRLGRAVGRDTLDAFNDLATGIGRQSKLILDNLGLIVKVEDANKKYAASLGKTVEELTDSERKQAFLNATMEAARARVATLGEDTATLADELGKLKATIANLVGEVLKSLIPGLTEGFGGLNKAIQENRGVIIRFFADVVEASGQAAQSLSNLGQVARDPFKAFSDFFESTAIDDFKKEAEQLRALLAGPQAGDEFLAQRLKLLEDRIKSLTGSFSEAGKVAADRLRAIAAEADFVGPKLEDVFPDFGPTLEQLGVVKTAVEDTADAIDGMTQQQERYNAELEKSRRFAEEARQAIIEAEDPIAGIAAAGRDLRLAFQEWGVAARAAVLDIAGAIANNVTDGLVALIDGTKSAKEAFRDMARSILSDLSRIIIQTLVLKAVQGTLGSLIPSAQGNVFQGGEVVPFQQGGVVSSPAYFPLTRGRTGLIGEAGPEAVMPLKRTASGRLGVEATGSGGGMTVVVNYNVQGSLIGERELFARHQKEIADAVAARMRTSPGFRDSVQGRAA